MKKKKKENHATVQSHFTATRTTVPLRSKQLHSNALHLWVDSILMSLKMSYKNEQIYMYLPKRDAKVI